jgi:hypothetical protein
MDTVVGGNMSLLIFIAILSPVLITIGWMFDGEG